jgi:hypothetical protein
MSLDIQVTTCERYIFIYRPINVHKTRSSQGNQMPPKHCLPNLGACLRIPRACEAARSPLTVVPHAQWHAHHSVAANRCEPGSSMGPSRFPTQFLVWVPRLGTGLWWLTNTNETRQRNEAKQKEKEQEEGIKANTTKDHWAGRLKQHKETQPNVEYLTQCES